jgi:hypothetical protein
LAGSTSAEDLSQRSAEKAREREEELERLRVEKRELEEKAQKAEKERSDTQVLLNLMQERMVEMEKTVTKLIESAASSRSLPMTPPSSPPPPRALSSYSHPEVFGSADDTVDYFGLDSDQILRSDGPLTRETLEDVNREMMAFRGSSAIPSNLAPVRCITSSLLAPALQCLNHLLLSISLRPSTPATTTTYQHQATPTPSDFSQGNLPDFTSTGNPPPPTHSHSHSSHGSSCGSFRGLSTQGNRALCAIENILQPSQIQVYNLIIDRI